MPYFSDQAAQFQALAQCIQNQLTMQGGAMDEATYGALENQRDILLDKATAMTASDLQATLSQIAIDRAKLAQCTINLNKAMQVAKTVDQIVAIAGAGLALATAITSLDPGAIATALEGAVQAVAAVLPKAPATPRPAAIRKSSTATGTVAAIAAAAEVNDTTD